MPDVTAGKQLVLRVDGVQLSSTTVGGATVWTWDSMSNAVVFEPAYVPQSGAVVTVSYFVACLP